MEEQIEKLIDKNTLPKVIEVIADVCYAKADHILSAWHDPKLCTEWEKAAKALSQVLKKLQKLRL